MGLTLRNNVKDCDIELDGGYSILRTIRIEVAKQYDEEFGNYYQLFYDGYDRKKYINKLNNLLKDDRFKDEDNDLMEFLFASDCEGKIGYKTCKKVYDLIKNSDNDCCLRYVIYSKNDWNDLRELLLSCYKHRANLYWS